MATVSGSSSYAAGGKVLTQARIGSADVKSVVLYIYTGTDKHIRFLSEEVA